MVICFHSAHCANHVGHTQSVNETSDKVIDEEATRWEGRKAEMCRDRQRAGLKLTEVLYFYLKMKDVVLSTY